MQDKVLKLLKKPCALLAVCTLMVSSPVSASAMDMFGENDKISNSIVSADSSAIVKEETGKTKIRDGAVLDPSTGFYTFYYPGANGWYSADGLDFWYEDGYRKGVNFADRTNRGQEIYDPASDAWYWLDDNMEGAKAKNKDVYQESIADDYGNIGKWVHYDEDGHMVKGWYTNEEGSHYYFDLKYGTMYKGYKAFDGKEYYFNKDTGILIYESPIAEAVSQEGHLTYFKQDLNGWDIIEDGVFWYENGYKMGVDLDDPSYRGKEIYDPSTDAWYWLDNVQGGAVAKNKDVYQESEADDEGNIGKWVRYDNEGHMIKGWSKKDNNFYYFDPVYGTMYKGLKQVGDNYYYFDLNTGILLAVGNQQVETTGFEIEGDDWFAVSDGERMPDYTGIWRDENEGWFYVKDGKVDFSYSSFYEFGGNICAIRNGKLDLEFTGLLLEYTGGGVPLFIDGIFRSDYNGVYDTGEIRWVIKDGFIDFTYNGLYYDPLINETVYVNNGMVNEWRSSVYFDIENARVGADYSYEDDNTYIYIRHASIEGCTFWIAQVFAEDPMSIGSNMSNGGIGAGRQTVSEMAKNAGAIFAVNGSGFDWNTSTPAPGDVPVVKNGQVLRGGRVANMMAYTYDGVLCKAPDWVYADDLLKDYNIKDTFVFGPTLIENGEFHGEITDAYKGTTPYPRSVAGMVKKGYYIFLVTDKNANSQGLTLYQARDLMKTFGCTFAYNLDGGGSATMYFNGKLLNDPADGTERSVIEVFYVLP